MPPWKKARTNNRKCLEKLLIAFSSSIHLCLPSHSGTKITVLLLWTKNKLWGQQVLSYCYSCMRFTAHTEYAVFITHLRATHLSAGMMLRNCTPQKHCRPCTFEPSQARTLLFCHCLCVLSEKMLAPWLVEKSGALLIAGEDLLTETDTICLI